MATTQRVARICPIKLIKAGDASPIIRLGAESVETKTKFACEGPICMWFVPTAVNKENQVTDGACAIAMIPLGLNAIREIAALAGLKSGLLEAEPIPAQPEQQPEQPNKENA